MNRRAAAVATAAVLAVSMWSLAAAFARRNGQWWIEAYHNVDVKPGAKS